MRKSYQKQVMELASELNVTVWDNPDGSKSLSTEEHTYCLSVTGGHSSVTPFDWEVSEAQQWRAVLEDLRDGLEACTKSCECFALCECHDDEGNYVGEQPFGVAVNNAS